jgi:GDP-4-dehydro-6-deoxy-D-mannose reductase
MKIQIEVDPQLIRPNDNKKIVGSYKKIKNDLGWTPEISIEKSLSDVIQYWQTKLDDYS